MGGQSQFVSVNASIDVKKGRRAGDNRWFVCVFPFLIMPGDTESFHIVSNQHLL